MKKFLINLINTIFHFQEKNLEKKYGRNSRGYEGSMVKSHISSGATLTFSSKLEENKEKIKEDVKKIAGENRENLVNILNFAKEKGAKTYLIKNAKNALKMIFEEEGIIFEKRGLKALYLNFITERKFSFKTDTMFVFDKSKISPYALLYSFYKWYSFYCCMPGFEDNAQDKIKNLDELNPKNIEKLNYREIMAFKQALARNREAMEFTLEFIKELKGAKTAYNQIKEGDSGASV